MTHDPFRVVVRLAVGAPRLELEPAVAPIAPDPFVPVASTPAKLITVNEHATFWEIVAVTVTLLSSVGANARQISEVPLWTLVLRTRTQFNPPPDTLVTVVLGPER